MQLSIKHKRYGSVYIQVDNDIYKYLIDNRIKLHAQYDKDIKDFYIIGQNKKQNINPFLLHRLITNCPKGLVVDHINHRTTDNRRCNLKVCTHFQNMQNISSNTSGRVGVSYDTKCKKWNAQIKVKRKRINLGYFNTKEDAIKARLEAKNKYYN